MGAIMESKMDLWDRDADRYIPPDPGVPYTEEEFKKIKRKILNKTMKEWQKSNKLIMQDDDTEEVSFL